MQLAAPVRRLTAPALCFAEMFADFGQGFVENSIEMFVEIFAYETSSAASSSFDFLVFLDDLGSC